MKKLNKKIITICLITAAIITGSGFGIFFMGNAIRLASADTSGTPFSSLYHMDSSFERIADIPYSDYITETQPEGTIYDIRDYGAAPENSFVDNRSFIQNAVNAAYSAGGGTVLVAGGEYKAANIELKSNITLFIASGAALVNITYDEDRNLNSYYEKAVNGFISANGTENVRITGGGRIKGNGESYTKEPEVSEPYYPLNEFNTAVHNSEFRKRIRFGKTHEAKRYYLIEFISCSVVSIDNVILEDSGSWTCRMKDNQSLIFKDVIIDNNVHVANSDGIDIVGGSGVTVSHCFIATGDDGVCLKTEDGSGAIDGVLVEDCEIMSLANSFKIGTGTYSDVNNVTVRNCYFFMAGIAGGYGGIAVEAVDGGTVSNIHIENIVEDHVTAPFLIWLGYRHKGSGMHDITIDNLTATGIDVPASITGNKYANVNGVTLNNINITYRDSGENLHIYAGDYAVDAGNMRGYPESLRVSSLMGVYYDLPCYGLFVRHAENLTVNNYTVAPRACNTRPARN